MFCNLKVHINSTVYYLPFNILCRKHAVKAQAPITGKMPIFL